MGQKKDKLTEEVVKKYQELKNTTLVGNHFGFSRGAVRHHLKKAGVEMRGYGCVGSCEKNKDLVVQMAAEGCTLKDIGKKICSNRKTVHKFLDHHNIPHTHFEAPTGKKNPSWKGGRYTLKKSKHRSNSYIFVYSPDHPNCTSNGYIREHRLVMEKKIGRYLEKKEVVHHIDGNSLNNDPDNLMLFPSKSAHTKYHAYLRNH